MHDSQECDLERVRVCDGCWELEFVSAMICMLRVFMGNGVHGRCNRFHNFLSTLSDEYFSVT